MRLKYHSLIALGISSVILGGCSTSGGFLNLGVADAFKKSATSVFQKRMTYKSTPLGNTGLSLPTFGTTSIANNAAPLPSAPTLASAPVAIDSYTVQQNIPTAAAPISGGCSSCAANAGSNTVHSLPQYTSEYYMPDRGQASDVVEVVQPTVVVQPTIAEPPANAVPSQLIEDAELPSVNPLPGEGSESGKGFENFDSLDKLDTEGKLEPVGKKEAEDFELIETSKPEEVVDGQNDKSILESAESKNRAKIKFDEATDPTHAGHSVVEEKPEMVVLRARPAQSHQVFDRVARQKKTLETAQASHKRNYRELNALRERRTNFGEQSYRQAKNTGDTDGAVEFKSLPPVIETTPAPVFQPKTNLVPLPKANREGQNDDNQEGRTRTADATNGHSAANMPRLPILRATTASSSSILSLKNLANVIEDDRQYHRQYNADHPTAHGSASTSVNVQNAAVDTVER